MFQIHTDPLTVVHVDDHGEEHDLNAEGEPIEDTGTLIDFIEILCDQGAFAARTAQRLIGIATEKDNLRGKARGRLW